MMKSLGTEQVGCDRRILKAFYTQYVAVLLIILVFTVGAFQRTTGASASVIEPIPVKEELSPIGTLEIELIFDDAGQLIGDTSQLQAVSTLLEEHDVRAVVTVATHNKGHGTDLVAIEDSLARLESLEKFFLGQGLSEATVSFVLGGPEARIGRVAVHFEGVHHDNLPL
jgi:hypothetical protein